MPKKAPGPKKQPEVITIQDSANQTPPKKLQSDKAPPTEKKHSPSSDEAMTKRTRSKPVLEWKKAEGKTSTAHLNKPAKTATDNKPMNYQTAYKGQTQQKQSVSLTSMSSPSEEENTFDLRHKINKNNHDKDCIDFRRCGEIHYTGDICPAIKGWCNSCGWQGTMK